MTSLLLGLVTATCLVILGLAFVRPARMYHYPFLAAAVFAGWVLPQLIGLSNRTWLPPGALDKTILMALVCLVACYAGFYAKPRPLRVLDWPLDDQRLLLAAAVLSLVGAYFFYQVSLLREEVIALHGGAWTGPITIFVFFASMLTVGLVLAVIVHLRRPSIWSLLIICLCLALYLDRVLLKGRRAAMVELFVIAALSLWFYRGKILPRWAMASVLVLGTLLVHSIADYRATVMDPTAPGLADTLRIDYAGNLKRLVRQGGPELTNALYNIEAADRRRQFDFGLKHWNGFVDAYIPGQIVGYALKEGMKFDLGDQAFAEFRHVPHVGSTHTGMSDAFASFWFFGAGKFFLIGFIMAKLYVSAQRGHTVAAIFLMLVFVPALEAITHSTDRFFMIWPKLLAFVLPAIAFARASRKTHVVRFGAPVPQTGSAVRR